VDSGKTYGKAGKIPGTKGKKSFFFQKDIV